MWQGRGWPVPLLHRETRASDRCKCLRLECAVTGCGPRSCTNIAVSQVSQNVLKLLELVTVVRRQTLAG